jgi:hypothetical protein
MGRLFIRASRSRIHRSVMRSVAALFGLERNIS